MLPPPNKSYTREVYQQGEFLPKDFIQQLPETFSGSGRILHNVRNQIRVYELNGQEVNVKKFCIPPIVNRILYSLGLRTPKAKTTFLNAEAIVKRGFQTPKPYGYVIERNAGLINYSYFVSEQMQDFQAMSHECTDKELTRALAKYTADLHKAGLMHRDYNPGNILYREDNGNYSFALVDINRFRIQNKPISLYYSVCNLMQPFQDDGMLAFFVSEYAKHREINVKLATRYVLFRRHVRTLYGKVKRALKKIPGAYIFLNKPLGDQK